MVAKHWSYLADWGADDCRNSSDDHQQNEDSITPVTIVAKAAHAAMPVTRKEPIVVKLHGRGVC